MPSEKYRKLQRKYKNRDGTNIGQELIAPCLAGEPILYRRGTAYFSSSSMKAYAKSMSLLIEKEVKFEIICSPVVQDKRLIEILESNSTKEKKQKNVLELAENIMLDAVGFEENVDNISYRSKVLSYMIAKGQLEIKFAIPKAMEKLITEVSYEDLYHVKNGYFVFGNGDEVAFEGSFNESEGGHSKNVESTLVFRSWESGDLDRLEDTKQEIDEDWEENSEDLIIYPLGDEILEKIKNIASKNPPNITPPTPPTPKKKINNLFDHQKEALKNWKSNNYKGIFEHATGSGKTVTALSAIDDHLKTGGVVLILVPSKLLFQQWQQEIKAQIDNPVLLLAGSGNTKWKKKKKLEYFVAQPISETPRIVVSTMKTASDDEFIDSFRKVKNLLIVVDEVHQIGSENNSRSMEIDALKRLGLSATPKRYSDPEGTKKIIEYFDKVIEPVYTLYDAINDGRLVKYEYFPHLLHLTPKESEEWQEQTAEIRREIAITNNNRDHFVLSSKAKMLLIQRSKISKKSSAKLKLVEKIIKDKYESGQKWLVYCEDIEQLNKVKEIIKNICPDVYEYHSKMVGDNDQTLRLYQHRGGVLVSIKCLDEGVDIPSISHALIIASSQNPRQFIQRRGRVLRVDGDQKKHAVIHDALIIPIDINKEPDQLSLLKSEMIRAFEFASNAMNPSSRNELRIKAADLGFNLSDIIEDGVEDDFFNQF